MEQLGDNAEVGLRRALERNLDPEVRQRLLKLPLDLAGAERRDKRIARLVEDLARCPTQSTWLGEAKETLKRLGDILGKK